MSSNSKIGTDISAKARQNSGQLKLFGRTCRTDWPVVTSARIASAMKTDNATTAPRALIPHARRDG